MGGKDTPPPCVPSSPMQSSRFLEKSRSLSISSSSSSASSRYQPSPIRYVPPSKTRVNLQIDCPPETTPKDRNYSPIRAYIDCLTPQALKCAIVGDSGVGKTSMLMSYVVDKFPEKHSPTIYDRFSSESEGACCFLLYFCVDGVYSTNVRATKLLCVISQIHCCIVK